MEKKQMQRDKLEQIYQKAGGSSNPAMIGY